MAQRKPFVLLDDARDDGAADAYYYPSPQELFVARRPEEVERVLDAAEDVLASKGGTLAGYVAYEAGLTLEPRLASCAPARTGAAGPLVWFGRFDEVERIPADEVARFLSVQSDHETIEPGLGPLVPQWGVGEYADAVVCLKEAIAAGDIYQANLTFPLLGGYTGDPVALYAALRPAAKAGYGALIFDGSHWLLSLSPEMFFSIREGEIRAKPMKGTRPRASDADRDAELVRELESSEKDRAENLMIVDLMRNDLSRVTEAGSVAVDDAFAVESYPTVHQMVTRISARKKHDATPLDCLRALFPCGSITGAPKSRAMELIDQTENHARGPYCGAIGRIGADGDAAFNVAIRTLRLTPIENDRGKAVLGVGSAIVADSDPLEEWQECLVKGAFARSAGPDLRAARFDLIETMLFDPGEGIALLERHLARMKSSAKALGFAFDRHEVRNKIQPLCFSLDRPSRVRLMASRLGAIALEALPMLEPWPEPVECIALPPACVRKRLALAT